MVLIKLTSPQGQTVYVNFDQVVAVTPGPQGGSHLTTTAPANGLWVIEVAEKPEDVVGAALTEAMRPHLVAANA